MPKYFKNSTYNNIEVTNDGKDEMSYISSYKISTTNFSVSI